MLVSKFFFAVGLTGVVSAVSGCAGTWDTVSSKKFRDAPFKTMFSPDDPMLVLRTRVEGGERAKAMRRLEEPIKNGRPQAEQDEALQMLEQAATENPSPVVRTAAIDALGRFSDPRAIAILVSAYHQADGRPMAQQPATTPATAVTSIRQVGARGAPADPLGLGAPTGFAPEFASTIRTCAIASLARSSKPEAVAFLARVATGDTARAGEQADDRDVRLAAVRGLGEMHQKESVVALAKVLQTDAGRDVVMTSRAHEGLVKLTGKDLPPEPDKWNAIVQAGFEVK